MNMARRRYMAKRITEASEHAIRIITDKKASKIRAIAQAGRDQAILSENFTVGEFRVWLRKIEREVEAKHA